MKKKRVLGFKQKFRGAIEVGLKQQTMRKIWKRPVNVGDELRLYTGLRTSECERLLPEYLVLCSCVEPFYIDAEKSVYVNGQKLEGCYLRRFAEADGFAESRLITNAHELMIDFIEKQYGLPFTGVVIYWFKTKLR